MLTRKWIQFRTKIDLFFTFKIQFSPFYIVIFTKYHAKKWQISFTFILFSNKVSTKLVSRNLNHSIGKLKHIYRFKINFNSKTFRRHAIKLSNYRQKNGNKGTNMNMEIASTRIMHLGKQKRCLQHIENRLVCTMFSLWLLNHKTASSFICVGCIFISCFWVYKSIVP